MSSWAKPGVKCVCILPNAKWAAARWFADAPIGGSIYTIREVVDGGTALLLHEIQNRQCIVEYEAGPAIGEPCFGIWRFRPLITKTQEQDVALFRHILDGLPVGEPA
jgi:hypothetical protein